MSQFLRGQSAFQSCDWLQVFFPFCPHWSRSLQAACPYCWAGAYPWKCHVLPSPSLPDSCSRVWSGFSGQAPAGAGRTAQPLWELWETTAQFLREEEEESCQREGKEFGLVTDRGPFPNTKIPAATNGMLQLLNHSNKPTGHSFLGVRLRASECLGFMMQKTVTDSF